MSTQFQRSQLSHLLLVRVHEVELDGAVLGEGLLPLSLPLEDPGPLVAGLGVLRVELKDCPAILERKVNQASLLVHGAAVVEQDDELLLVLGVRSARLYGDGEGGGGLSVLLLLVQLLSLLVVLLELRRGGRERVRIVWE